jgi:hypothetical protein
MPFTFSHPAIILPLTYLPKKWYSLTGLVVGSLAPDFEYFLRMKVQSNYSHTFIGLFWFDLTLGLLLAFLFHNFARDPLFDNLPLILKSRLEVFQHFHWNAYFKENWIVVSVCVLIGAASHLFWDGFTHEHGYFAETIPGLTNAINVLGRQIPIFKILQHSSTLVGGLIIVYSLLKLLKDQNVKAEINLKYWSILIFLTFVIISVRLLNGLDYKLYGHVIVTGIAASLISLVLTPWIVRIKK